ncbi:MAG: DUF4339 domain-containing protein [Planctomycetaceae bacterium]|jgi:hypothetical protein|nr:DUF4339 domain-containing protein [Planctomycetaceae bacterium]
MGIRFFCPNGHKLHVKSHLAGLNALCPECGVKLVVPLKSTRKSSKEINNENNEQTKNNQTTPQNKSLDYDWYVCNPENGKQQGPLKIIDIKNLIQKKQITPNTFLWHEGLQDWITANTVFTELK